MPTPSRRARVLAGLGPALLVLAAGQLAAPTPAGALSTTQQNLVALGYLRPHASPGEVGPATIRALQHFQADRCLDATGQAGPRTLAQLTGQVKAVQARLRLPVTGLAGARERRALVSWQRAHRLPTTGVADGWTMARLELVRMRACGGAPVKPLLGSSLAVRCPRGTLDVGRQTGYWRGRPVPVHLCAIPGLRSSSAESTPGSAWYVKGANGWVVVNARVAPGVLGLVRTAQNSGVALRATSSFRTMAHQRAICRSHAACRRGDHRFVLEPGWSNHQMGFAVDFAGTSVRGGGSCARRATQPGSGTWAFLERNARRFGLSQYSHESWHWDFTSGSTHC